MRMYDLIEKKKHGESLTTDEIRWMVRGYTAGKIPDYQMSAMLMAIWFRGMEDREITDLTLEMAHSGDTADLSSITGFKVDKHSTGGVGDKTTLIVGPVVASLGVRVAKMSGRGLGFTGGTIDKLESIPGFQTEIPRDRFFELVNQIGIAVIGQSGNMVPADKKMYALRDVTATVDSIPLIAASIMSKKLAGGSDGIVLDVKTGSGAFMKTMEGSVELAEKMVAIGTRAGRKVIALITDMDVPLGCAIGNAVEVKEAMEVLHNRGPEDLREVSLCLSAQMLCTAGLGNEAECYDMAEKALQDGSAWEVFLRMAEAQGGDISWLRELETEEYGKGIFHFDVTADRDGFITDMDTDGIGMSSVMLKAGRAAKEDTIDHSAGILLFRKTGDAVKKGDVIARLLAADESLFAPAAERVSGAVYIGDKAPEKRPLIYARVSADGVEILNLM